MLVRSRVSAENIGHEKKLYNSFNTMLSLRSALLKKHKNSLLENDILSACPVFNRQAFVNGFIDWLHGYYLCGLMLHTCTHKMADLILLPLFADNFTVFVLKQQFLYLF